jgi:hypothetical protein
MGALRLHVGQAQHAPGSLGKTLFTSHIISSPGILSPRFCNTTRTIYFDFTKKESRVFI